MGAERVLSSRVEILGPSPISSTKQPCDLGQDACLDRASVFPSVSCVHVGWHWSRCSSISLSSSSNIPGPYEY